MSNLDNVNNNSNNDDISNNQNDDTEENKDAINQNTETQSILEKTTTSIQTWLPSLSNVFSWSKSNGPNNKTNKLNEENKNEDTDIMSWFNDIMSGCESDKNKRSILSETWNELSSNNIFSRLTNSKLRKAATTFGKLSHRINISYPPKDELVPIDMSKAINTALMTQIKYCIRHALASYKKVKLAFRTKESVIALKSTKTLLRDFFDIPAKDIIIDNSDRNLKQFRNKLHSPRFYLIIDNQNKKIVLSIRGTASTADRITDINANAKVFSAFNINGYAHEGILASTKYIFENITVELVKQCKKYTDYEVLITGHSLGGGVSALLGLMYYKHPIICKQNRLKCFCFASPPVLSKHFTDKNIGIDYIFSIILSTDFVTRLSIESVRHYNLRNDLLLECKQDLIDECMDVLHDKADNESVKFLTMLKSIAAPNPHRLLYPLGRILWFVPNAVMEDDVVMRRNGLMKEENGAIWRKINKYYYGSEGSGGYVLCDATNRRDIFQEFVIDFPESLLCHLPARYLSVCGTSITKP